MITLRNLFLTLLASIAFQNVVAQDLEEDYIISFSDAFSGNNNPTPILAPLENKADRRSSKAGLITIQYESEIPDSMKKAIDIAAGIWESKIHNTQPIIIKVNYGALDANEDIRTDVRLFVAPDGSMLIPRSLYYYLFNDNFTNEDDIWCATININNQIPWICDFTNVSIPNSKNISYAVLRSFSRVFGFGCSVSQKNLGRGNIISFDNNNYYTIFDTLVKSTNGTSLIDIPILNKNRNNPQLASFSQPSDGSMIYVGENSPEYKLYAPSVFVKSKSMVYLDNSASLMHYDLNVGDKQLKIDSTTVKLLEKIGWNFNSTTVNIVGENIPENGICSAYDSHSFSLSNPENDLLSDINWQFRLETSDNGYITVANASGVTNFGIESVTDPEEYKINPDGDLNGLILCDLKINGVQTQLSYRLSLELSPLIFSVTTPDIIPTSDYFYNCSFVVDYSGCDHLMVNLEQENMSIIVSDYVYEPFLAHVSVPHISKHLYTWIDIIAENDYGETIETIEIPPLDTISDEAQSINPISRDQLYSGKYEIYDISGILIMSNATYSDLNSLQSSKIYILKTVSESNEIKTIKYIKR